MTNESAPIVPLDDDRADEVAALMGRAFQDDPWAVYACPDPDERAVATLGSARRATRRSMRDARREL